MFGRQLQSAPVNRRRPPAGRAGVPVTIRLPREGGPRVLDAEAFAPAAGRSARDLARSDREAEPDLIPIPSVESMMQIAGADAWMCCENYLP